jgi:predicted  nucleic acid-binding Zn-ribbon protein
MTAPASLLDLQGLDLAVDRLAARIRALESGEDLAAARAAADAAERELGELGLARDVLDRDAAKLEHEVDSLSQKATAEEQRMRDGSVANARELEAIGREIENLRSRIADREDELLVLMERREDVDRRTVGSSGSAASLRAEVDAVAGATASELAQVTADLTDRRAERAALAATIDPELLDLYDDLRAHKKGVGAAALVDGVCQGCHETLSSVELDHVKRADGIPRCEHCRRILVL